MKATLFISILMLSFGIYAQSDTLNQKDSLGKKQGYWIIYGKDEPNREFPAEGKIEEGTYKDDRKHGKWKYYYKDGESAKIIGSFKHGRPDGFFEKYYPNGRIKVQGTFNKMRYADTLKRYNEEGVIIYEGVYNKEGKEHGIVRYFHDNGKPDLIKTFNNGVSIDTTKRFSFNGDLIELVIYDSRGVEIKSFSKPQVIRDSTGKEIYRIVEAPEVEYEIKEKSKDTLKSKDKSGYYMPPSSDDKPWMEGEFKNGRLWNGKLYIYDDDGLLLRIEIYKDGEYHSDGQFYSEEPSHSYKRKEDECIKKYGPNGEMNAEGEFKNGCLWNGRHFIFDKDGILLKVKVYKNGRYHSDGQL